MRVILASASPRRARLLRKIAGRFGVEPASVCERIGRGEAYVAAAKRLAGEKARKVALANPCCTVIGADTIAYLGKRNIRKTNSLQAAKRALSFLSGKTHSVATGVAVVFPSGKTVSYAVKADVRMKRLDGKTIDGYLRTGEWKGRAGCYDVSGIGGKLVAKIRGERKAVVGLPLARLAKLIR